MAEELFDIKDGAVLEHEVNGAAELIGDDGVGLEGTFLGFQAVVVGGEHGAVASTQDGGFADGPPEIGVAEFGAAQALDLTGAGDGALDQATVAGEVLDGGETVDGVDLVEDGEGQGLADAGDGLEEGVIAGGEAAGGGNQLRFEPGDHLVVVADGGQIGLEVEAVMGFGVGLDETFLPGIPVTATAAGDRLVALGQLEVVEALEQFGAAPDVGEALAQEGADGAFGRRIHVGGRDEIGGQEAGEFFGVDAVVFVFAAVNGLEVEGVGQHELEAGGQAGVGQPVPAEEAFTDDGEVVFPAGDLLEEEGEVVVEDVLVEELFALAVDDADVPLAGVEVDPQLNWVVVW